MLGHLVHDLMNPLAPRRSSLCLLVDAGLHLTRAPTGGRVIGSELGLLCHRIFLSIAMKHERSIRDRHESYNFEYFEEPLQRKTENDLVDVENGLAQLCLAPAFTWIT